MLILIEVLVVIAIIAILASLLLPALEVHLRHPVSEIEPSRCRCLTELWEKIRGPSSTKMPLLRSSEPPPERAGDPRRWLDRSEGELYFFGMSATRNLASGHGLILRRDFHSRMRKLGLWALALCGAVAWIGTAKGGTVNNSTVYELNADSSYMQGCFPPCLCPLMLGTPAKATFLLTPTGFDGLYNNYAVTNVSWLFHVNGTNLFVTGSGVYKVGGEFALEQELTLDLLLSGGGLPLHFDSGLVPDSAPFPKINLSVSLNQVCFNKVFNISAAPVPPPQVHLTFASTNQIVLSWPAAAVPYVLQASSDLSASNWITLTNVPTSQGQQNQIVLARPSGNTFYRLQPSGN